MVLDNSLEMMRVKKMPNKMTQITAIVEIIEALKPCILPAMKMVLMAIKKGNLPLHGTKLLVNIAINLSRGESMIRHPTQPAALQPNPMHMVVTKWWFLKVLINVEL